MFWFFYRKRKGSWLGTPKWCIILGLAERKYGEEDPLTKMTVAYGLE